MQTRKDGGKQHGASRRVISTRDRPEPDEPKRDLKLTLIVTAHRHCSTDLPAAFMSILLSSSHHVPRETAREL